MSDNTIYSRRSIRKFSSKDVPIEIIEQIIDAARMAPSPKNRQPWKYIVFANDYKRELLENMLLKATEEKLGTLWIANTCFVYSELIQYLNTENQLIGAIALGYPEEQPLQRPRKSIEEIVEYKM